MFTVHTTGWAKKTIRFCYQPHPDTSMCLDPFTLVNSHTYMFCQANYAILDAPTKHLMCPGLIRNQQNHEEMTVFVHIPEYVSGAVGVSIMDILI